MSSLSQGCQVRSNTTVDSMSAEDEHASAVSEAANLTYLTPQSIKRRKATSENSTSAMPPLKRPHIFGRAAYAPKKTQPTSTNTENDKPAPILLNNIFTANTQSSSELLKQVVTKTFLSSNDMAIKFQQEHGIWKAMLDNNDATHTGQLSMNVYGQYDVGEMLSWLLQQPEHTSKMYVHIFNLNNHFQHPYVYLCSYGNEESALETSTESLASESFATEVIDLPSPGSDV